MHKLQMILNEATRLVTNQKIHVQAYTMTRSIFSFANVSYTSKLIILIIMINKIACLGTQ